MRKVVRFFLFLLIFILFYFLSINEESQARQKITQTKVSVSQEATVPEEIQEAELPIPTIAEPDTEIQEPQETFEVKSKSYYYQCHTLTVTEYESFTVVSYPLVVTESDILDFFNFELEKYPFLKQYCFYELKENSVVLTYPKGIVALDYADTLAEEILLYIQSLNTPPAVEEEQIPELEEPLEIKYSEPEYQELENVEFPFYSQTSSEPINTDYSFEVKLPEFKQEEVQPDVEEKPIEETPVVEPVKEQKSSSSYSKFSFDVGIFATADKTTFSYADSLGVSPGISLALNFKFSRLIGILLEVDGSFAFPLKQTNPFMRMQNNVLVKAGLGVSFSIKNFFISTTGNLALMNHSKNIDIYAMYGATIKPSYLFSIGQKTKMKISLPVHYLKCQSGQQISAGIEVGFRIGEQR